MTIREQTRGIAARVQINALVEPELAARVDALGESLELSRAGIVRRALLAYLPHLERTASILDAADQALTADTTP